MDGPLKMENLNKFNCPKRGERKKHHGVVDFSVHKFDKMAQTI